MKMKRFAALLLAALMVLSLAACGSSSTSSQPSGSAEVNLDGDFTATELRVAIWDNNQRAGLQQIADEWTETSGVKVNVEVIDWGNYWTLLEAGANGGDLPDVFWMHSNTAQMYMENDLLLNLDPYIAADANVNLDNYYEGIVDLFTRSDGIHFAVPKDHDTNALLYNKAIFDQYNVAYPEDTWTYEDMYEAAKAIYEASDGNIYGVAMNTNNNQDSWYNFVYSYGAQVITDDHKGTTIGSEEGKNAMEMVRKLLTVGAPQSVVAETGTDSLFMSGKVAMIMQGSYMINAYYTADNHEDYYWAMLPYADVNGNGTCEKEERYTAYNGLGWAAAFNTKDPNAAYSLISAFCCEAGQIKQSELGVTMGGMPGVSEAFASAFPGMDISAFIRIEEEGSLFFRPYTRNTTIWEDKLTQSGGFLDAWQDPSDPELMRTACDNAQKIIEDAIAAE
ncbi:MAG: sugar ABC transporter substrate-binding protein [Oscillospiraceae bacterium]|nr:sugar ABC transporter substrate-binding protein [Oscillospiraceae bacterium]